MTQPKNFTRKLSTLALATALIWANGSVIAVPTVQAAVPANTALTNTGFETYTGTQGVADGWAIGADHGTTTNMAVVDAPVKFGSKAQRVSGSTIPIYNAVDVYQEMVAEPNTSYTVTAHYNIEQLDNTVAQLYFVYYDSNDQNIGSDRVEHGEVTNGEWIEMTNTAVTPANTAYFRIYAVLRAMGENGSGTFYVDDVHVRKTVEDVVEQEIVDIIPAMTSNTAPLGRAFSEPESNMAWYAFDKSSSYPWLVDTRQTGGKSAVGYDFQTPVVAREYSILNTHYVGRAPQLWTFEGWDGAQWRILDTQSVSNWAGLEKKTFPIENKQAYWKYRLNITASNGDQTYTGLNEFYMKGYYAKPVQPTGFWNSFSGNGTVTLEWNPQNGAKSYSIYQDGVKITTVAATTRKMSYKVPNLTNNQVYKFEVSAANAAGESPKTEPVLAMPYTNAEWLNPAMTSNTLPVGRAWSVPETTNSFYAFDYTSSSDWRYDLRTTTDGKVEVGYDFETPTLIREYTILPGSYANRAPKSWTFEGWNGEKWVELDKHENVENWTRLVRKYFAIANDTPYSKYRLLMTANNGDATYMEINELQLLGSYQTPVTPQGLWNSVAGNGTVSLQWQPINGVTEYYVYQDGVKVATVPARKSTMTYTATGLTNGQTYRYSVSAANAAGESSQTDPILAMPYSATNWVNPGMTSNTAPSGEAFASLNGANAYYMFDHSSSLDWRGDISGVNGPFEISYDFKMPTVIQQYTLLPGSYPNRAPMNWTFDGWDGAQWKTLDTKSVADWTANGRKHFTIDNTAAYSKYRLYISANNGDQTYLELDELQLIGTK